MANKEELIKSAKIIFVENSNADHGKYKEVYSYNRKTIEEFLSDKNYLKVGSNKEEDFYYDYHYTTKYWYKTFPLIASYIGFELNMSDFIIIPNNTEKGDYSYLKPIKEKKYKIIVSPSEYLQPNIKTIYLNNQEFEYEYSDFVNTECYEDEIKSYDNPYHNLYKFAHIPSIIYNLNENNGRTILLSCNSHAIPLIPILAYYYKKVIIMDNRFPNISYNILYEAEENTIESVLMFSCENNINKFLEQNF